MRFVVAMSPALGMHPSMAPHLQQLQAHLLRSAAAAALMPHGHPLQQPPGPPHPHSHPHSHGLAPHTQLFSVPPHSAASITLGPHGGGLPPKSEVRTIFFLSNFLPIIWFYSSFKLTLILFYLNRIREETKGRTCLRRPKIKWFSGIFQTWKNSMDIFKLDLSLVL